MLAEDRMRARSAAAVMEDCCTGSAAITSGSAHSAAVPQATIDHLRHAPLLSKFTGLRTSPHLSPDQRTSVRPRRHPARGGRGCEACRARVLMYLDSYVTIWIH